MVISVNKFFVIPQPSENKGSNQNYMLLDMYMYKTLEHTFAKALSNPNFNVQVFCSWNHRTCQH